MPRQGFRHPPASASGRSRAARRLFLFLLSGLALAAALPPGVLAQEAPQPASPARDPVATHVSEAALRFGLPEPWIRAVLQAESGGDPAAVSAA